jgi:DNA recombination protein RmuC
VHYDKFEGFVADLIKIGRKSTKLKRNIAGLNKLVEGKGNLIISVEKKKMGQNKEITS